MAHVTLCSLRYLIRGKREFAIWKVPSPEDSVALGGYLPPEFLRRMMALTQARSEHRAPLYVTAVAWTGAVIQGQVLCEYPLFAQRSLVIQTGVIGQRPSGTSLLI
jgi:hypothetical protein